MTKKFAIVLALFVISIVCCAGCIGPGEEPVDPVDPVVPVDPVTPVDPVVPVEEYSVMFMLNYGDAGAYTAETVKAGETVSKPANPTRSGYTFKGWFTAAEGGAEYDFTQAVNADVTIYAQWKKKSSSSSGGSSSSSGVVEKPVASIGGKDYTSIEEAIKEAETSGGTITLVTVPTSSSIDVGNSEVTIDVSQVSSPVSLTYAEDTEIKIKATNDDNVEVFIEDKTAGTKKEVIFEEATKDGLLVPAAAVDEDKMVADAFTPSGLTSLFSGSYKSKASPVDAVPAEQVQDGWTVLFYEPVPTALGDEAAKESTWTITLKDNIDLPTGIKVSDSFILELNGKTLAVSKDTEGNGVFHVVEGGELTINGEGTVNGLGNNMYSMAIWADGGDVTINGGSYINIGAKEVATGLGDNDDNHYDLIYAKNQSKVTINGGTFTCDTPQWTLNLHDTMQGSITVNGGTFVGFNPALAETELTKPYSFVAKGHVVSPVEQDDKMTWVVSAGAAVHVKTANELREALNCGGSVVLDNDIDLSGVEWMPIGTAAKPFSGTFNGNGKTISNLKLQTAEKVDGYGFIGVASGGDVTVQNLNFENVQISAESGENVGTVIGIVPRGSNGDVTLTGITVKSGTVSAKKHAAGLIGKSYTVGDVTITDCINYASVTGTTEGSVGGIAAIISEKPASLTIENCQNYGEITGTGNNAVGGLVGSISGEGITVVTIKDSRNNADVVNLGAGTASGIATIGKVKSIAISNLENIGNVTASSSDSPVAGLIEGIQNTLTASGSLKNNGDISGNKVAGGLFGQITSGSSASFKSVTFENTGDVSVYVDGGADVFTPADKVSAAAEGAGAMFALLWGSPDGVVFEKCSFTNSGDISAVPTSKTGMIAALLGSGLKTFDNCTYENTGVIASTDANLSRVSDRYPSMYSLSKDWVDEGVFGHIMGGVQVSDGNGTTASGAATSEAPYATAFADDESLFVMFDVVNGTWDNNQMVVEYNSKTYTITRAFVEGAKEGDWRYIYTATPQNSS